MSSVESSVLEVERFKYNLAQRKREWGDVCVAERPSTMNAIDRLCQECRVFFCFVFTSLGRASTTVTQLEHSSSFFLPLSLSIFALLFSSAKRDVYQQLTTTTTLQTSLLLAASFRYIPSSSSPDPTCYQVSLCFIIDQQQERNDGNESEFNSPRSPPLCATVVTLERGRKEQQK